MSKLIGVILAGGKSKRMGVDKSTMAFREKEMIAYSIDALKKYTDTIYISSNNEEHQQWGYPVLEDAIKNIGPLSGIYSALIKTQSSIIVLPCDSPFVESKFIQFLIQEMDSANEVFVPSVTGKLEPLFAIYKPSIIPIIKQQIEKKDYKVSQLFSQCKTKVIPIDSVFSAQNFVNINSPKDKKDYE